jgi:predicted ATP-grasp superfamily ATP-dependent carboligase/beta-phosphoglucomutase-like phosphatase (HAD superfamily)
MTTGLKNFSDLLASYTVVLASTGFPKALAMARSLKAFGAKVLGVTNYALDPHRFSRFFDRVIVLGGVDEKSSSWAIHVAEVASTHGADLVLPVGFVDVVTFSSYLEVFDRLHVRLAAPKASAVLKVSRKDALEELVGDLVCVPRSLFYASPSKVNLEAVKSLRLPLVVKGIGDKSRPEYFSSFELAAERAKERAPCLVQEYVAGKGRGYYAVAFDGEVLIDFAHERIYESDPSGGGSIAARGLNLDPRLFKLGRKIVRRLNWTGPLMVETKWVPTRGEYHLLELNPKFWGSLPLPVSLGYHFPTVLAVAYLKGLDVAKDFCRRLLVRRSGEYYFLLDGLYYMFWIPEVWVNMLISSRVVSSDIDLLDPARVVMQFAGAVLGELRLRKEWSNGLISSLSRLKDIFKRFRETIAGVIFDLDGTLVNLRIPWLEASRILCSDGLLYKWENIREGFVRLWNEDKSLYDKASLIVEEFERKYSRNMKIMADVDALNNIRREYRLTYCLMTFQSESVVRDIIQKIGLHVDLVLGRDSGFGPLKENFYHECLKNKYSAGKFIVLDDDVTNIVDALRLGYLPIWVTESKYHKINSLRLGIPHTDPRHLHAAILSLLKASEVQI